MEKTPFDVNQPFVDERRYLTRQVQKTLNALARWYPITGSGSPEGVVEARQFTKYIDVDGTTGSIEYRKMQPDIDGDKSKGWVLI